MTEVGCSIRSSDRTSYLSHPEILYPEAHIRINPKFRYGGILGSLISPSREQII